MSFLKKIAEHLYKYHGDDLQDYCIVFPNLRAGLFFKKYLAQMTNKPVWSPAFRSLDALMEEIAGITQADNLSLIFYLYQAYKQHTASAESFDNFYSWGEMLLDDFDEVDKQLVNARDLFRNVSDLKGIDGTFCDYLSEKQKEAISKFWQYIEVSKKKTKDEDETYESKFAAIWKILYPTYELFRQQLKEKSLGYSGMIQREAVGMLNKELVKHKLYKKYVFVGFNALTKCEADFFKLLNKKEIAIFFWDYDDYYLDKDKEWHEAGKFMRKNVIDFPSEKIFEIDTKNLTDSSKNIEIISVPSETGQAKEAGKLLEQIFAQEKDNENWDWSHTTIALPDEHLLQPVLSSLPEVVSDVNITMGYPFTCSPANTLFERLASLQKHVRKSGFYHNDVCMILQHPYIQDIIPTEANVLIKDIIKHNRIYVPLSLFSENELLQLIFRQCIHVRDFSEYLIEVVTTIAQVFLKQKHDNKLDFHLEYLYTLYTALQRIHDVLSTDDIEMDVQVFCRLLRKNFASLKIPFSGEPLNGLQLMGMLETRTLDFDNVIILSMNEGVFPKNTLKQSFIPYTLRKAFGLATSERHDAISAYHFYRLIQRAKNVYLIYNSAITDSNTGEMSRFLRQLIYEEPFKVQQRDITFSIKFDSSVAIEKKRTDEVRLKLGRYLSETDDKMWLSPSAMNSYLDCSLKFYFRYIEDLKEKEEMTDEIDPSAFGKLLHKTMELIYQPYIHTEITVAILAQLQKNEKVIQEALYKAFALEYFHTEQVTENDITGRNIIIYEVLQKYVRRILEVDRKIAPFTVLSLEKRLEMHIPINSEGKTVRLKMKGIIDRLDDVNQTLRIIDYKTGKAQRNFTTVADLFDPAKTDNHAVFQTLVYAYMTRIANAEPKPISLGLYIMKELFEDEFNPLITRNKSPITNYLEISDEFETELNRLLTEIFLSEMPFTQTENTQKCQHCPYADICHRR